MKGLVYKSTGSWYNVRDKNGDFIVCRLKGKLRIQDLKVTNPVSVGDIVEFELEHGKKTGLISNIQARKNYLIRKSVNLSKQYHILASNIDQAIIVATIKRPITLNEFIDRFLVSVTAYNIPGIIIVNKIDLYDDEAIEKLADWNAVYSKIGYEILPISATESINIDKVKRLLKNKTSVLSGNSGVGKSSLLQTLIPEKEIAVKEISKVHQQGVHTTTFAEMFDLPFGGMVIDTPGIRGLGVVDINKDELGNYFPEFIKLKPQCKFNNCVHINEPKCAIKKAVEKGLISPERYNSYLSIFHNDNEESFR
jgi:ribosome biogenesis GTPase